MIEIRLQWIHEADRADPEIIPDLSTQAQALRETVERFNESANWAAGVLFARTASRISDRPRTRLPRDLRDRFGLTAQTAILVIHRVCEAYKRDKAFGPGSASMPRSPTTRVRRFMGMDRVSF